MKGNDMPEVSVVITYYNSSPFYFRKCLDSICSQTFTDFEAIIVCNEAVYKQYWTRIKEKYEKKDNRLKFVTIDKKGASIARNYAISICKGKYLAIVDGDDYVENNFLQKLYEGMKRGTSDICICGVVDRYYPVVNMTIDRKVFFSMPGEFTRVQYVNFSVNKMYKLDIIREYDVRYPEGVVLGEDAIFLSKYFEHCNMIACIGDGLYHYLDHRSSLTHVYNAKYFDYEKRVVAIQYKMFTEYPLCKREKDLLEHWLFVKMLYIAWYYLSESPKNTKEAMQIFTMKEMDALLHGNYTSNQCFDKWQLRVVNAWKNKKMPYYKIRKVV